MGDRFPGVLGQFVTLPVDAVEVFNVLCMGIFVRLVDVVRYHILDDELLWFVILFAFFVVSMFVGFFSDSPSEMTSPSSFATGSWSVADFSSRLESVGSVFDVCARMKTSVGG